uniref:Ribosomal protein S1 n=1 Tax=Seculamonas ecuadoriensis TaxID=221724 RepID=M4QEK7_SECEC|nr:ribosomal protein S1 [Seculamonas ecuadoriensis]AGH24520.1 ribosomal protein S1 [Seculamonas ecuadoriensis]
MVKNNKNTALNDNFKNLFENSSLARVNLKDHYIEGTIVGQEKDIVTLDVGFKTNIQFIEQELGQGDKTVGMKKQLAVHEIGLGDEEILFDTLSFDNAIKTNNTWHAIVTADKVPGIVLNTVNGGFSVGIGGIVAFLPKSLAKIPPVGKKEYIHSLMQNYKDYKVVKSNLATRNIVVTILN